MINLGENYSYILLQSRIDLEYDLYKKLGHRSDYRHTTILYRAFIHNVADVFETSEILGVRCLML